VLRLIDCDAASLENAGIGIHPAASSELIMTVAG
jgi:hypothetical protein